MSEMKRIQFASNVPQQLAVVNPEGDMVAESWGDRVHFETTDGRILDVNMRVAAEINLLEIRPGEQFCICKRVSAHRDAPIRWDVWLAGDAEKQRAQEERPELEQQLRDSIRIARGRKDNNGATAAAPLPHSPRVPQRPGTDGQNNHTPKRPVAISERSAAEQPAMAHLAWAGFLLSQSQALIDVMAAAVDYAGKHYGTAVKNEDVRALVITGYINYRQNNGGANVA